jgi:hypothetical protein
MNPATDLAPSEPAIGLSELFAHADAPLHEHGGEDCHSFEIHAARNALVREAAYLHAQTRGLQPGHELDDWLAAEREVDARVFAGIAPVGFVG